ncbi:MAG: M14 family metallopeptidase [Planctomycetota bacterium]
MQQNQRIERTGALVFWLALAVFSGAPRALSSEADVADLLPPVAPWNGASLERMAKPDDPWITPSERTGLVSTPDYAETMRWLKRICQASDRFERVGLGRSGEGREILMVVACAEGTRDPEVLRQNGRPTVLAQAGIHSGEIDGKDAGMMLLRDLMEGGRLEDLLQRVNLLFIPILSVDGHERSSRFSRINQRGPAEQGWRTNARNLNLNRDYAKADTLEMQALLRALETWQPDLYIDLHVTDGIDYQYDVTYGWHGPTGWSPSIAGWLDGEMRPALDLDLRAAGHVPGPLIFAQDNADLSKGIVDWMATPRFSNAYGDARQLPTILVENHSLKPYRRRVLGTHVLLESVLRTVGEKGAGLREAIEKDRTARRDPVPLSFRPGPNQETIQFLGIANRMIDSPITGSKVVEWLGEPITMEVPVMKIDTPAMEKKRPVAYWIPPAWGEVVDRLELHGIVVERQAEERTVRVEVLRLEKFKLDDSPYEGRVRVRPEEISVRQQEVTFPEGACRVPTNQPLGTLAVLLLEPESEDSFFQWGFFHPILQRTEYFEVYALEPLARQMLEDDQELAKEFNTRLKEDPEFANNPGARLRWFYERSPFYDQRYRVYPVAREIE